MSKLTRIDCEQEQSQYIYNRLMNDISSLNEVHATEISLLKGVHTTEIENLKTQLEQGNVKVLYNICNAIITINSYVTQNVAVSIYR